MRRRAVGLFFICSAVVPLAIVSTAWACGVLATLKANPSTVAVGQPFNVTGVNYSGTSGQPVSIRLDSRTGPLLGTAVPDPTGRINATVAVPGGTKAQQHLLLGLQNNANGTPKSGTPGRTTITVTGASRSSTVPGAVWGSSKPGAPGAGTVSLDGADAAAPALPATLLGVALSLGLLGMGLTLVRGKIRRPALSV